MPLTFEFEEEYRNSRSIDITHDSFQQDFVFYICGNFYESANVDATYGPDDDIQALNAAYSIIPPFRSMPLYAGGNILLTLDRLSVSQVGDDLWKVEATYAAKNEDQTAGNAGPNQGDKQIWSNNFVQLSFNVTAAQEKRTMSRGLSSYSANINANNKTSPYKLNYPSPMGLTTEGADGADVYVRGFSFSITRYMTPNQLTFSYVRRLYRMSTTVNNNTFFGFPAGSVLFLEATGSGDVFSTVPVTFDFQMRPNFKFTTDKSEALLMDPTADNPALMFDTLLDPFCEDTLSSVTPFPGNAFSGWAVVDWRYGPDAKSQNPDTPSASSPYQVQRPLARFIHNVYELSNFNWLEL